MPTPEKKTLESIEEALEGGKVPNATDCLEEVLSTALMVPMDDPSDPECRWGLPTMVWGPPGAGKSRRIDQAASMLDLPLETIYPSTKMPEDFNDLPVVIQDQLRTACMMTQVNTLNQQRKGVMFVDEASLAVPAVQGAMLPMVLDRCVGSTDIHPQIRPLLAGNPSRYAAGGWSLSAPFANRMLHIYVHRPSRESLIKYIISEGTSKKISLSNETEKLKSEWPKQWATVKAQWAGFMKVCTDAAYSVDPDPDNAQSSYCWPSPRSWEMAMRANATARCLGRSDSITHLMIEAAVGEGAALEFIEYLSKADLPDPMDVLTRGWKIDTQRLDRSMAVATGFTALIIGTKDKDERIKLAIKAWQLYGEYLKAGLADLVMDHLNSMANEQLAVSDHKSPALKEAAEKVLFELGKSSAYRYAKG